MRQDAFEQLMAIHEEAGEFLDQVQGLLAKRDTEGLVSLITQTLDDPPNRAVCVIAARAGLDLGRWDLAFLSLTVALALSRPVERASTGAWALDERVLREASMCLARRGLPNVAGRALRRAWEAHVRDLRELGHTPQPGERDRYMGLLDRWLPSASEPS